LTSPGPRYSTLLFDLDGTLINSREDLVLSVQEGFKAIGFAPPETALIVRNIGKPLIDFPRLLEYEVTPRQQMEFTRYYRAYYSVHCGDHTEPYPGVRETLEFLHGKPRDNSLVSFKMAIVTTKSQDQAEGTVRTIGLTRYFDLVRGWVEGRKMKPDPEPYVEAMKELGAKEAQTLIVGDSEQDVLAAQAAGIDCCACLYGFRDPDYMRSLKPTYCITSFPEVRDIALAEAKSALT
jgi:HAD superfamily hydrolase (TIGR01549 family)